MFMNTLPMDLQIPHHLFALFSVFLFIIVKLKERKKTDPNLKLPPSPWKLPIIGHIPHLVGTTPHRKLRDMAKTYGPLFHLQLGEIFTVVVSSPEYAREVMKSQDLNFASRSYILAADILIYGSSDLAFTSYGDYWRHLKKIFTVKLLSTKRVHLQWPIREREVNNFMKKIALEEGSVINLSEAIMSVLFSITSRTAFGKLYKEQDQLISLLKDALKLLGGFYIGDLFPTAKWLQHISGMRSKLEKLHQKIDSILEVIVNDHREAKSMSHKEGEVEMMEDFVDVLLKIEDNNNDIDFSLTNKNIKAIIFEVIVAGSETAATTINWTMTEMIKNPTILEKTQNEVRRIIDMRGMVDEIGIDMMKYMKAVIKETLRLHPPGPLLVPRECIKSCEINGYHIPSKSKVLINVWANGRDPNYWTEPDRFYPERFIDSSIDFRGNHFEFTPFGAGRRICPGINNGLANVELVLALLLYHFDWKLPIGIKNKELDMTEMFGLVVTKKVDLLLIPKISRPLFEDCETQ